jgi:hypothetical protein
VVRPPRAGAGRATWGAGMAATDTVLHRFTNRVILLRDDPKAPSDVPACDGTITYRDDSHLTAAYVATRWRQFAAALR